MRIPIITTLESDAVVEAAMRKCSLTESVLREAYELGAKVACLAIMEETSLRLETLRLEAEMKP